MRRIRIPLVVTAGLLAAGCGADAGDDSSPSVDGTDRATVVVTYSVLGAVVADLVGDAADVTVLMPDGVDPHEWEPSPRDIEAVAEAAVVVANGVDLEESLLDVLATEAAVLFTAGDHVTPRPLGESGDEHADEHADEGVDEGVDEHSKESGDEHADEHADEGVDEHSKESGDEHAHEHGGEDPHLWMDPLAMRDVVIALAPVLAEAGIDVSDRVDAVTAELEALVTEVETVLAPIPVADRLLVTGHESLGWFADRFDLELVGAVIPSLTSQAEPSAGDLADLTEVIEDTGVPTIFTELGTPPAVVEAIADATGAGVVEIATHDMPDEGGYRAFVLDIATRIVTGLSGETG